MLNIQEFKERNSLEYKPVYIQKGSNYFLHKNQHEDGMKLVHQLNYKTINDYIKGIKENDYDFYDDYPGVREVMVLGSSNVGKSSLINALNGATKIARTAKTPGTTQSLHFYLIQNSQEKNKKGLIIDTPGYGYVEAPVHYKAKWKNMIFKYLSYGVRVNMILFLVNGHLGLKNTDIQMLENLQYFRKPIQVVITKIDKIKNKQVDAEKYLPASLEQIDQSYFSNELIRVTTDTSQKLQRFKFVYPQIHLVSSSQLFGIQELRARLGVAFDQTLKL